MKMNSIIKKSALVIVAINLFNVLANAQNQSGTANKSVSAIELSYYKKADNSKIAVALVTAQNRDGKFVPAKNVRVKFYSLHNKEEQLLNSANTNSKGQAAISIQKELPLDDSLYFSIEAKIENDSLCQDAQEQMHYKDVNLTLNLNTKDTTKTLVAKLTEMSKDGKEVPVKNTELKFYVRRLFGTMPAAEDNAITTDNNGIATFAYPKSIPGDTSGSIILVAKMEDNKQFGNVENNTPAPWGKVLVLEKDPFPRALWEPYAPLPLVITISTLFGGVWFTYFFIFNQLRKISKEK